MSEAGCDAATNSATCELRRRLEAFEELMVDPTCRGAICSSTALSRVRLWGRRCNTLISCDLQV